MNNPHDNDRGSANKRQSPSLFDPVKPNQAACNKSKENKNISNVPTSNVTSASSPPKNSPQFENSCRSHSRASQSKNQRQHKKKQKSSSKPSSTSSNPHRRGIRSKRSSQRKEKEKENRPPLPTSALSLIASPSPTDRSKTPVCAMDANEPTVLSSNMDTPLVREVLAESEPLMTDTRNADAVTEQSEPQSPSQSQQDAAPPSPPFNVTDTSSNGSPNQNDMSNQSTSASCDKSSPPPPPPPSTTVPASESSENITAQSMMLTEHNRPVNRGVLFYSLFAVTAFSWFLSVIYGLFFKAKRKQLPPIDEPLLLLSASELTARIKNRSLKCEQVIRAYINRIEQVQKHLNAVIDSRFDEAIQEAKTIDQQLKNATLAKSLLSKPLLGVPFSCKDSIAVKGMVHTAGSWYRRNVKAEEDAPVVANLRAAGAIPLVMTNVSI